MNEQLLKELYVVFGEAGYTDPFESFKELMATNEDAVADAYASAKQAGYTDSIEDFNVLVGYQGSAKKKDATVSDSEVTGSEPTRSRTAKILARMAGLGTGSVVPAIDLTSAKVDKAEREISQADELAEILSIGRGELVEVAEVEAAANKAGFSPDVIDQYYQKYQGFEPGEWRKEEYAPESKEAFKDATGFDADELRLTDEELDDFFKTGLLRGLKLPEKKDGLSAFGGRVAFEETLDYGIAADRLNDQGADRIAAEVRKGRGAADLEYGDVEAIAERVNAPKGAVEAYYKKYLNYEPEEVKEEERVYNVGFAKTKDALKKFDTDPRVPARQGTLKNFTREGEESTHLYSAEKVGDKWVAFPTLFQNPDGTWVTEFAERIRKDRSQWMGAYEEALDRGEVIEFGDDQEAALSFGEGSWKPVESRKYVESLERGDDADKAYERAAPNMNLVRNIIAPYLNKMGVDEREYVENALKRKELEPRVELIKAILKDGGDAVYEDAVMNFGEEQAKQMLLDNRTIFEADVAQLNKMLERHERDLEAAKSYIDDGKSSRPRTPLVALFGGDAIPSDMFDLATEIDIAFADEKENTLKQYYAFSDQAQIDLIDLNNVSSQRFGMPVMELVGAVEEGSIVNRDATKIVNSYYNIVADVNSRREALTLRLDAINTPMLFADTQASGRFITEAKAIQQAWANGANNNRAGFAAFKLMLGDIDMSDEEVVKRLAERFERIESQGRSRSQEVARRRRALGSNAFEAIGKTLGQGGGRGLAWAAQTMAQSFSQYLNAGISIVPFTTAGGAAVGAAGGGVGALPGAAGGFTSGLAMAGFMVEFNSSIVQAVQESGYDATNPKELEAALQDPEVFRKGVSLGVSRGIPIAVMDLFTGGIAGKIGAKFLSKGALSPLAGRMAGVALESVVLDIPSEMAGELAAQLSANVFTGEAMSTYEVLMEGVGAFGQTAGTNATMKALGDAYKKNSGYYIKAGGTIDGILSIQDTPQALSRFIETQLSRGNISESEAANIQSNIQSIEKAESLIADLDSNVKPKGKKKEALVSVAANLEAKKRKLQASNPEANSDRIAEIDSELRNISNTGEASTRAKEIVDAFQKQEARDIPDAEPAEGVQEVEEEVREQAEEPTEEAEVAEAVVAEEPTPAGEEVTVEEQAGIEKLFEGAEVEGAPTTAAPQVDRSFLERQRDKALKALAKLVPITDERGPVKIIFHDNSADYEAATGGYSRGTFDYYNNTIHINVPIANNTTIAHETFHAVLLNALKSDQKVAAAVANLIRGARRAVKDPDLKGRLDGFIKQYEKDGAAMMDEEFVTQLAAELATGYPDLSIADKNSIKNFIKRLLRALGLPVSPDMLKSDQEVVDILNTLSRKIGEGEVITEADVSTLEKIAKDDVAGTAKTPIRRSQRAGDVRKKTVAGKTIEQGRRTGVKTGDPVPEVSIKRTKDVAPKVFIKNAKVLLDFPIVQGELRSMRQKISKFTDLDVTKENLEKAQKVYDVFVSAVSDNLEFLVGTFREDLRDLSTLWYDGANILAQSYSEEYEISLEQAAAVMASLSPQKDWYQNVRLAELVFEAYRINPTFTQEMLDKQVEIYDTQRKEAAKKGKKINEKRAAQVLKDLKGFIGTKMLSGDPDYQSYWVRLYHEVNTTKDYKIIRPDGEFMGFATKEDGERSKVAWGSYTEIGKAVSVMLDGDESNITKTLGNAHKIRSFYNNIVAPQAEDGSVTMDTHATGAALLLPVTGKSTEVKQNFSGSGGVSSAKSKGIAGLYYAYADAYRDAGKRMGLLPRQIQSITWEAIRLLFTDSYKRNNKNVKEIRDLYEDYGKGEITKDAYRKKAIEAAGGIGDPSWAQEFGAEPVQAGTREDAGRETERRGSSGDGSATQRSRSKGNRRRSQRVEGASETLQSYTLGYAPYREGNVRDLANAEKAFESKSYQNWISLASQIAKDLGIAYTLKSKTIGVYKATSSVPEASALVTVDATRGQAELFAALMGSLAPDVQNAVMLLDYSDKGDVSEYTLTFPSKDDVLKFVENSEEYGVSDLSYSPKDNSVLVLDFGDFNHNKLLDDYGKKVRVQEAEINVNFLGEGTYSEIIRRERRGIRKYNEGKNRANLDAILQLAEERADRRSGNLLAKLESEKAKRRKQVKGYLDRFRKKFGLPEFAVPALIRPTDAKRIAKSYDGLKVDNSASPEVRAAYEQLAREVEAQYEYLTKDLGVEVEFMVDDPYADSEAMFADIYDNNKLRVFKGGEPHAFLDRRDKNGVSINEKFRAVHDYFGHSIEGNQFGPIGEERAWLAHSMMFSPLARQAMTTETRGQNSWVNTSPKNKPALDKFRKARQLIATGKVAEGMKLRKEAQAEFQFADQKVDILPDEFVQLPEEAPVRKRSQRVESEAKDYLEFKDVTVAEARELVDFLSKKYAIEGTLKMIDPDLFGAFYPTYSYTNPEYQPFVAINEMRPTKRAAVHEFLHPFVRLVRERNPELFEEILQEAMQNKEVRDEVAGYKDVKRAEEAVTIYLDQRGAQSTKLRVKQRSLLQKLLDFLSSLFHSRRNKPADLVKLSPKTTVDELFKIFEDYDILGDEFKKTELFGRSLAQRRRSAVKMRISHLKKLIPVLKAENLLEPAARHQEELDKLEAILEDYKSLDQKEAPIRKRSQRVEKAAKESADAEKALNPRVVYTLDAPAMQDIDRPFDSDYASTVEAETQGVDPIEEVLAGNIKVRFYGLPKEGRVTVVAEAPNKSKVYASFGDGQIQYITGMENFPARGYVSARRAVGNFFDKQGISREFTGVRLTGAKARRGDFGAVRVRLQMGDAKLTPQQAVEKARSQGFSDAAIKDWLRRVVGLPVKDINKLMTVTTSLFDKVPEAFSELDTKRNPAGTRLWNKLYSAYKELKALQSNQQSRLDSGVKNFIVKHRLNEFIKENNLDRKKDKAKIDAQRDRLKASYTPSSLSRYESKIAAEERRRIAGAYNFAKNNPLGNVFLNEQNIANYLFELMDRSNLYQAKKRPTDRSDIQISMTRALYEALNLRPSRNAVNEINATKRYLSQRKKGKSQLMAAQREVVALIRKIAPQSMYMRGELLTLIKKVMDATPKNLDFVFDEVVSTINKVKSRELQKQLDKLLSITTEKVAKSGILKGVKVDSDTAKRIAKIKSDIAVLNTRNRLNEFIKKNNLDRKKDKEKIDAERERLEQNLPDDIGKKMEDLGREQLELEAATGDKYDANRLADIATALNILQAGLFSDQDMGKVAALTGAINEMTQLVAFGRTALSDTIAARRFTYLRQLQDAYYEVAGVRLTLEQLQDPKYINDVIRKIQASEKSERQLGNVFKRLFRSIQELKRSGLQSQEALSGLLDRIIITPVEVIGGGMMQEQYADRVREASRIYKEAGLLFDEMIQKKMAEILGVKDSMLGRSKIRRFIRSFKKVEFVTYIDNSLKGDAKEDISNRVVMSQNEMAYLYNQYKDPANNSSFETKFGPDYERVMADIEAKLDPRLKEFADYLVNEVYPQLYARYNPTYKRMYDTDMPINKYYGGPILREGGSTPEFSILPGSDNYATSVGNNSTKVRVQNKKAIQDQDIFDNLANYQRGMEYFSAYGEVVRDMNKLFENPLFKSAVAKLHGKSMTKYLHSMLSSIANNGATTRQKINRTQRVLMGMFVTAKLAISPVIMIKQLTSAVVYMSEIGVFNYLKSAAKTLPTMVSTFKEVYKNSVYVRDRVSQPLLRSIEVFGKENEFAPSNEVLNVGMEVGRAMQYLAMAFTKIGDIGAIMIGGMPNYAYYKSEFKNNNPDATEQQAIDYAVRKFEKDSQETQQSSEIYNRDFTQNEAGPLGVSFNIFLTAPRQYLRKTMEAYRNMSRRAVRVFDKDAPAAKGTFISNVRQLIMYHALAPTLFQYVGMGLPGLLRDWREDDDEDLIAAAILGNLHALFVIGQIFAGAKDLILGKPWAGEINKDMPLIGSSEAIFQAIKGINDSEKETTKQKHRQDLYNELLEFVAIPAATISRWADNVNALMNDGAGMDIREKILRLLNYSEYQIEGPKDKKGSVSSDKLVDDPIKSDGELLDDDL